MLVVGAFVGERYLPRRELGRRPTVVELQAFPGRILRRIGRLAAAIEMARNDGKVAPIGDHLWLR